MKGGRGRPKQDNAKRAYKSPRKGRVLVCTDPLNEITYFETGKKKKCYACPDTIFISDVDYLIHLEETHEGQRMHCCICSECGKTFGSSSELQQHTLSKCGTQARFTCTVCNKKLMSAGSLYTHMLVHGESNYTCNFCGKQFHNVHHLKAHERTHTKVPVYTCEVCGKGFAHRQSIITHSSLHTGIKPYSCEYCGKGFSCISNLLKHRKTHASTCGVLPMTSHKINNSETKLRIRMNTPATAKQKNYSKFKLVELDEKRTLNAVRLLTKNKDLLFNDVLVAKDEEDLEDNRKKPKVIERQAEVKKRRHMKDKKTLKSSDGKVLTDIDIIKHEIVDVKPAIDKNVFQGMEIAATSSILKEEEHRDINFDADDLMPLSTYITVCKNEYSEAASSLNDNEQNNSNIPNIACDICTASFETQGDFSLHLKTHSTGKLDIEYVEGFEENDFDNDDHEHKDGLRFGNVDDKESNNNVQLETEGFSKEAKRKIDCPNFEEGDLLIQVKRPGASRTRRLEFIAKEKLKEMSSLKSKRKSKGKRSGKRVAKRTFLEQIESQDEALLNDEVKDEVASDCEESNGENIKNNETAIQSLQNVERIVEKPDIVDDALLKKVLIKYKDRMKYECKICGTFFKSLLWLQKHQQGKGFVYDGQECSGRRTTTRKNEKAVKYSVLGPEIKDETSWYDTPTIDHIDHFTSRFKNKNRFIKGRQQFMCKICGTILKYYKFMVTHQMGKGFKNKAGDECAGPSVEEPDGSEEKSGYLDCKDPEEKNKKERKLQCEVCEKIFTREFLLKKHQKNKFNKDHCGLTCATVGNQKLRKCDYCPLYLEKGAPIKEHKRTLHADILKCDICNKIFSKPDTLAYHRMAKHKLVPRYELPKRHYTYVCDKCGAQFKHKSSLTEHGRTGCSSGPLFQCEYCDARLHNIYTLKTHMWKHVEEKKHLCTFCGMKFMMKVQLKNHLYRHTGEKPFKCTMCPKAFAHSTSLDTHMSTHTGIKRYICLACGKRFSCYGNLDKHKASKSCKEWYSLNGEKKKLRILDEPINTTAKPN